MLQAHDQSVNRVQQKYEGGGLGPRGVWFVWEESETIIMIIESIGWLEDCGESASQVVVVAMGVNAKAGKKAWCAYRALSLSAMRMEWVGATWERAWVCP